MISKIFPLCSPFIRMMTYNSSMLFSESFRSNRDLAHEVLRYIMIYFRIQNLASIRDVVSYMMTNNQISNSDFQTLCQRVYFNKHKLDPYDNLKILNDKVRTINFETCDINTLAYLSGILPVLSQHITYANVTSANINSRLLKIFSEDKEGV